MSPDPGNAGADIANPQTWNGYAYVGNNPLSVTDPSGLGFMDWLAGISFMAINDAFFGLPGAFMGDFTGGWFGSLPTVGSITGCGGAMGNCGGFGGAWTEQSPIGQAVQDPGRFIFDAEKQQVANQPPGCGPARQGFGMGVLAGATAEAGVAKAGASVQGSVGAGAFVSGAGQLSGGVFASGGAVAYAGKKTAAAPAQSPELGVLGLYAGYGPGAFITNAGSAKQLSGPFWTLTVNIGIGVGKASVSLGSSNGIYILTANGGAYPYSSGLGFSVSTVTTTTAAASTSRCP